MSLTELHAVMKGKSEQFCDGENNVRDGNSQLQFTRFLQRFSVWHL